MTGRVDIIWFIFKKGAKQLKIKSQYWKNKVFGKILCKCLKIVMSCDFYFNIFAIKNLSLNPPEEPREHHLGEVLQGRSKSKFNIIYIVSYLIALFFRVQVQ